MTLLSRVSPLALLAAVCLPVGAQSSWLHLSSSKGDFAPPLGSTEQTACLVGDFNKDGADDFLVASRRKAGRIEIWLSRKSGRHVRHLVWNTNSQTEAGGAVHDIDGDGDLDVVLGQDSSGNEIHWWENPYPTFTTVWIRRTIKSSGRTKHHDQVFGDFDGDGKVELVSWNQGAKQLLLFEIPASPRTATVWASRVIATGTSDMEGLAKADINGDGTMDIVGAGRWWRHSVGGSFVEEAIDTSMKFTRSAVGQLIPGGRPEVVLIPGDANGNGYWYRFEGGSWKRTLLGYFYHGHTLEIADLDGDSRLDILTGEMFLGRAKCELAIHQGDGKGAFKKQVLSVGNGIHEGRLADVDGDGDPDIVHKPYNHNAPRIDVWINNRRRLPLNLWRRHLIDGAMPANAVFIKPGDLDGDGDVDAVAGGHWYRNPGTSSGGWTRIAVGGVFRNVAAAYDFDADGDLDLFGTQGVGSVPNAKFAWAENDGKGGFTVRTNIPASKGDFLQGVVVDRFSGSTGPLQIAMSWHAAGHGVQLLTIPKDPKLNAWTLSTVSSVSQDEDLSSGDIDGDSDPDLMLGTVWLDLGQKRTYVIGRVDDLPGIGGTPVPDRNELFDVDGDGDLDVVVSLEKGGSIVWFENPLPAKPPTGSWQRHVLGFALGQGFSLDAKDFDRDGDLDVVLGEHRGTNVNRVMIFENQVKSHSKPANWAVHLVDSQSTTVIDHHDGTRAVDVDGDGDLDILSIGWTRKRAWWFENLAIRNQPQNRVARPAISPRGGVFRGFRTVTLSSTTPGSSIHYTTDGSSPTTSSPKYAAAFRVAESVVVQARAFKAGWISSEVVEAPFARLGGEIGSWRFDAGSGSLAFDDSAAVVHGQLRGPTWSTAGRVQGALSFDGTANAVDLGARSFGSRALSLSAWIHPDRHDHLSAHDARILSQAVGTGEQDHFVMLSTIKVKAETRLRFRLRTGGATTTLIATKGDVPVGRWSHVTAIYTGAHMVLYLNGIEVGRLAKIGVVDRSGTARTWLGNQPPTGARGFDGMIDELRLYERALREPEIVAMALEQGLSGLTSIGRSTRHCGENQRMTVARSPTSGDVQFGLGAAGVPRNVEGVAMMSLNRRAAQRVLGLTLYVDLTRIATIRSWKSDGSGRAAMTLSLAGVPPGLKFHVQSVWESQTIAGCPPPVAGLLNATDALEIVVQ